jgi:mRNA interferase HigB
VVYIWLTSVRIIAEKRIRGFCQKFADTREPLQAWVKVVRQQDWPSWADLRRTFPIADRIAIARRNVTFTVFNIKGNHYRLITVIHHKPKHVGRVYIRGFLTHAQYSKDTWKDT